MSVPATRRAAGRPLLHAVPAPARVPRRWLLALLGVFAVAAIYHWLQSFGHVTPAVFTDELMFAELARSFADGQPFEVRDRHFFIPSFLPALLQAPAWLFASTPVAYGAAKTLNAVLMCSAAFPAYWLARRLLRPTHALIVAVASVAGAWMLYHGYLTSEAAAYPVFLLAVAACVWALEEPSPRRDLLAVAVLALALVTRLQFVVLPLVFVLAILLVGRRRMHLTALVLLGGGGVSALVFGYAVLGFYQGAWALDYTLGDTIRWGGWTAALLPFAAGMLVVPGALLGLGYGLRRPRSRAEHGFAVITALLVVLLPLEAGLIAAGEAARPLERYAFYVVPLLFIAYLSLAERGAGVRLYTGVALALGGLALVTPFSTLALDRFSFDSTTLSAVAALGRLATPGDAAVLVSAGGLVAAGAAVVLRRRPELTALLSISLAFLLGVAAYSGDRQMTRTTLESLTPAHPDWLDRSGVRADVLVLPGGSLHAGWVLESWNRNVGRTFHLGDLPDDPLPYRYAGIEPDGTVREISARHLVVNGWGSQIELAGGERLATPVRGVSLYRAPRPLRLRSFANGLYADGWSQSYLRYRAFRERGVTGSYRITLTLPAGRLSRRVELEAGPVLRRIELAPGTSRTVQIPASVYPLPELAVRATRSDFIDADTPRARLVAFRVDGLEFVEFRVRGARLKSGTARQRAGSRK